VVDRLVLASVYKMESFIDITTCGQLIRQNLKKVKANPKWAELKMVGPQLVIAILEEFEDEAVKHRANACFGCGQMGHWVAQCPNQQ
jgi:hypothetical protein